jgi:formylglycine-generating enzyme required for sulfatase activity
MDERVVYPGEADREAAQERAEGRYWKAHAALLAAQLASLESRSTSTPEVTGAGIECRVPDIGDFTDLAVIELLVKPGEHVKREQSLISVESDKASMEIPASRSGTIHSLHVKIGDKVSEGSLIASYVAFVDGQVFRDAPWSPEMLVLPRGRFLMGSPAGEPGRSDDEGPQHEVTIGYGLAMGRYPVTFDEWDTCVADGGTQHKPEDQGWGRGRRPVIDVSWQHAQEYVTWLNEKLGIAMDDPGRFRLPSEAEWEYACRAGTKGLYSTPDGLMSEDRANYDASYTYEGAPTAGRKSDKTTPVGIYPANGWGLYDMHGNVLEWVQDGFEESYRGAPTDGRAWESGSSRRVIRGGPWSGYPKFLRSAYLSGYTLGDRGVYIGFRLARTVS